ncbi:LLM class flavin-dependent oxidoreductase, partial [Rhodococcus qingshengii]|nr:LLM class flavin-dependent oxidoreductase [Rhodococcus qingshengii]
PETKDQLADRMRAANERASAHGRTLDYGLRVHRVVRDTEKEAREYAEHLVSKLDDEYGPLIRNRAHDSGSLGVSHQARARARAYKSGSVEPH